MGTAGVCVCVCGGGGGGGGGGVCRCGWEVFTYSKERTSNSPISFSWKDRDLEMKLIINNSANVSANQSVAICLEVQLAFTCYKSNDSCVFPDGHVMDK